MNKQPDTYDLLEITNTDSPDPVRVFVNKHGYEQLRAENAALKAELTEAKKDAERYRWLRDKKFDGYRWAVLLGVTVLHSSNGIDKAIDEAMKGK